MDELSEINEIDENVLFTKITIFFFELKALRGGMDVTETTNYSYDAEFSVNIVHGVSNNG